MIMFQATFVRLFRLKATQIIIFNLIEHINFKIMYEHTLIHHLLFAVSNIEKIQQTGLKFRSIPLIIYW